MTDMFNRSRRQVLQVSLWMAGGVILTSFKTLGCATKVGAAACPECPAHQKMVALTDADLALLHSTEGPLEVVERAIAGHNILRERARSIEDVDPEVLEKLENKLRETLASTEGGVGLAAPQVGIGARAIIVMRNARSDSPHVRFYINPAITKRSDEITLDYEGCLSVPDICGLVKRNQHIVVEHGFPGHMQVEEAIDFDARIFQHEIDHLDGVLYVDRVDGELQPRDKLKELRERLREQQPVLACTPMIRGRLRDEVLL